MTSHAPLPLPAPLLSDGFLIAKPTLDAAAGVIRRAPHAPGMFHGLRLTAPRVDRNQPICADAACAQRKVRVQQEGVAGSGAAAASSTSYRTETEEGRQAYRRFSKDRRKPSVAAAPRRRAARAAS